jgi:hypothetical protein
LGFEIYLKFVACGLFFHSQATSGPSLPEVAALLPRDCFRASQLKYQTSHQARTCIKDTSPSAVSAPAGVDI